MANYTSFRGADIIATFNGQVIGELQSIRYSMPREHIPSEYATKLVMNVDGLTKVHLPEYISEYEPKNNAEAKVLLRKGEF